MPRTRQSSAQLLILVALILGLQVIQAVYHYPRFYQLDEYWRVHTAIDQTPRQIILQMAGDTNNPPLPRILDSYWIKLMGGHHQPHITRIWAGLIALTGVACLIRTAFDLFSGRGVLWVTFIYGTLPLTVFYGRDAGPYALLLAVASALTLLFVRWLRSGNHRLMALYVLVGCIGMYSHYFTLFIVFWHALALVFLTDRQWRKLTYGFYCFGMVALGFGLGWGLPLAQRFIILDSATANHVNRFTIPQQVVELLFSVGTGAVLLLVWTGVFSAWTPRLSPLPQAVRWGLRLCGVGFVAMFLAAVAFNQAIIPLTNTRNLSILLGVMALLAGWALTEQPNLAIKLGVVSLALIQIPLTTYGAFNYGANRFVPTSIIKTLNADIQPNSRFIIEFYQRNDLNSIPLNYILQRGLRYPYTSQAIFLVHQHTYENSFYATVTVPHPPAYESYKNENAVGFSAFTADAEQLIWISPAESSPTFNELQSLLNQTHYQVSNQRISDDNGETYVRLYERIPLLDQPLYRFNDAITLENWRMADVNVTACESVLIENWWQTEAPLPANYNMSYSLIAADGQTTLTDHGSLSNVLPLQWQPDEYYYDGRQIQLP
ncbi:MAG: hypothetical protein ACOYL5_20275, partial [Phototrophicaceae bacterium]